MELRRVQWSDQRIRMLLSLVAVTGPDALLGAAGVVQPRLAAVATQ
jgi:hypothetical protein